MKTAKNKRRSSGDSTYSDPDGSDSEDGGAADATDSSANIGTGSTGCTSVVECGAGYYAGAETNRCQGIEAGYGTPAVTVRHCLLVNNRVGLRFGDSYDWADDGMLDVSHSIAVNNSQANVLNLTDTGAPKPGAVQIACSMVDDASFDGTRGNVTGAPTWDADGCVDDSTSCDGEVVGLRTCD